MDILIIIFVLFTIGFVYGDIQLGSIQTGVMNDVPRLLTVDNIGLKSCARRCLYHKSCHGFNYHPKHLVCEMLVDKVAMINTVPDVEFSYIDSWTLSNDVCYPNPCKEGEVCVKTKNGEFFCQSLVSFCSNNPCLNGGECSSELSSAVCRCGTGFSGPVCEISNCDSYNCNAGTCIEGLATPTCTCNFGYYGSTCQSLYCKEKRDGGNCSSGGCLQALSVNALCLYQDSTDSANWVYHEGGTPSVETGPSSAIVGRYYYYFEVSSLTTGAYARLISTSLSIGNGSCLKFWYHMYGINIGTLRIYLGSSLKWSITGDQGNKWYHKTLYFYTTTTTTIWIQATYGNGFKGDISIDDVQYLYSGC